MLLYNVNSWHYRLVLYIFSNDFFMETMGLDFKAMDSQYNSKTKEDEFQFIYKKKSKTVNFCPYCRAVLAAVLSLPFVYLWRLYPHKPKPKRTHAEIMKSIRMKGWIARIIGSSINILLGIKNIVLLDDGTAIIGIIQILIGISLLTGHLWAPQVIRWIILHSPKWERQSKPQDNIIKSKKSSKLIQKIKSTHDVYCPPIFFIQKIDEKKLS